MDLNGRPTNRTPILFILEKRVNKLKVYHVTLKMVLQQICKQKKTFGIDHFAFQFKLAVWETCEKFKILYKNTW